jgi:ABC-type Mn2+/Zn2+ transport system permease subunit
LTTGISIRIILVTVLGSLTDPFQYAFMQRALLEVLLLAVPAGFLGAWIVLRRLAFLTHAVGAATFPGLVLGYGLGFSPWLGAFGMAAGFAGLQVGLERRTRLDPGAITGLLLATALAAGSVLVSDVFHSSATVDGLLFGSLLGIGSADLARTALLDVACLALLLGAGRGLLATSYAPAAAAALGFRRSLYDAMLLLLLGAAVVTSAATIGGFAVSGLLVVPAATARLVTRSVRELQLVATGLAAVEATAGLALAFELDVPPGAAIAVLAAAIFLAVTLAVLPAKDAPAVAGAAS